MSISKPDLSDSVSPVTNLKKTMHVPGSILGRRYQIIQKLGKEAGKTYLAKDLQVDGDAWCVVEQLSPNCDSEKDWQIIKRHLLNEIVVLERLGDHPQIPQFYGYFIEERQFYLVREYIDGDNLEQQVERKIFDEASTIYLIQDTLRILDFIHKTNVIHRNVQPVHLIKRKRDNTYVLINFGAIEEIESTKIDLEGELIRDRSVQNWYYDASEQKAGEYSFRSDLYALAKTAVYVLTGRSPEELSSSNYHWQEHCQISTKLEAILTKMMAPKVEQRYSSALEVLYDLRPLLKIKQIVGGRYLITQYIDGNGGIQTYLADNLHRQYQSPCSVKQIELPVQGDSKIKIERRFAEELLILQRIGYHEQIPQLWDHFEENDQFYLVQEYIQGDSLARKIAQQKLSTLEIVQILRSALAVLEFIHSNRMIHRNLKPDNLIVRDRDSQVVLTNFGILNDLKTLPNATLSHSYKQERKNYWSPEQIAGRPTVSSDLYALGMTVIEALTLAKPETFVRNEQTGKLLWAQNLDLDRRLLKIVDKMVELDLGQRYQSAQKILDDLQKINITQLRSVETSGNIPESNAFKFSALPIIVGVLGILCLLASIEFAFPIVRPAYYWYQGKKSLPEEPQTALKIFTKAIDLKPQSHLAWSGRGDALSVLEQYPQALEAYIQATQLNPNSVRDWKKRGDTLYRLEKYTEAIAAYNRALELDRDNGELYNRKGRALYQLQQYESALAMQQTALEIDRFNARFLSDRAKSLLALKRYYNALTVFNRVQAIEPSQIQLWQDKFLVLDALNRPQEAQKVSREVNNGYIKMLQEQPEDESIWLNQGNFFASNKMYQKAVDSYKRAIELKPNFYEAWLGLGKALIEQAQGQEAITALDKALQIRPQSYLAMLALGLAYQNQNNFTIAIANYNRAIEINPNYAPLWRNLGLAYYRQQKYDLALKSLTKAIDLAPGDVETLQGLANVQNAIGQEQKALSTLEKAIEIEPQNISLWNQKGSIYIENNRYNEACQTYRQSRLVAAADSPAIVDSMMRLGCRMD